MANVPAALLGVKYYKGVIEGSNFEVPCFLLDTVFNTTDQYRPDIALDQTVLHFEGSIFMHVGSSTSNVTSMFTESSTTKHYFDAASSITETNRFYMTRYGVRSLRLGAYGADMSSASGNVAKTVYMLYLYEDTEGKRIIELDTLNCYTYEESIAIVDPSIGSPGMVVYDAPMHSNFDYGKYNADRDALIAATFSLYRKETDPYLPDDEEPSGPGGGEGDFSDTGDDIEIPGLPSISAVDTGFVTLFNPTAAQVKSLANYMWSSGFDLDTFKKIVANPIDCILGFTIVPVNPPNAGSKTVKVGNIDTGVSLPYLSSQFVEVDCGSLDVHEFWGSYLDYSPYTKMSLYLPYIGIVPLDIDDVMNTTVHVVYHVDVLSGALVAYVQCHNTQLYTYIGQCSSNVPITSNDFTNTVNGILGIAGNIGSLYMTGGASAPSAVPQMVSNAINALKPNVQKSGAMSGTGGLMGVQKPYLICQRPRQSVPANQNKFTGYPSNITAQLGDISGYTEVDRIHLDGMTCTQDEMTEIMDLLQSGVIL